MLGSVAMWPISAVTIWSARWLDGEGLENKVVAVGNLSEVCISGAVADRWADQGVHCKLWIGFVFHDGEFEIGNDASSSFAQTDRSLSKIHRSDTSLHSDSLRKSGCLMRGASVSNILTASWTRLSVS